MGSMLRRENTALIANGSVGNLSKGKREREREKGQRRIRNRRADGNEADRFSLLARKRNVQVRHEREREEGAGRISLRRGDRVMGEADCSSRGRCLAAPPKRFATILAIGRDKLRGDRSIDRSASAMSQMPRA